jgi:hypothetical protein
MFERDIEKVAGAAGRIENASAAKLAMKVECGIDGLLGLARVDEVCNGGDGVGPIGAQRLDQRGDDEALDVGARRVVRAEGVALGRVERTFEKSAEDGRLHVAPVGVGRLDQQAKLGASERQGRGGREEPAIELEDVALQDGRESAAVHGLPQRRGHLGKDSDIVAVADVFEQAQPTLLRQKIYILRERSEDTAGEELSNVFGRVLLLQRAGEDGQLGCNLAGDAGGMPRRIERVRIEPDGAQAFAVGGNGQIAKKDAIAAWIGERKIGLAGE